MLPIIFLLTGIQFSNWFSRSVDVVPIFLTLIFTFQFLGLPYAILKNSNIHFYVSVIIFGLLAPIFFIISMYFAIYIENYIWQSGIPQHPIFKNASDFYFTCFIFAVLGVVAYVFLIKQSPNKALN